MRHMVGVTIVAISTVGLASASIAMVAQRPDVSTTLGRLLYAGALANGSLALTLFVVAVIPLRKRQPWSFWVLCAPIALYGVPMLVLDGTNVARQELASTLAPQVAGLGLLVLGLVLVRPTVLAGRRVTTSQRESMV